MNRPVGNNITQPGEKEKRKCLLYGANNLSITLDWIVERNSIEVLTEWPTWNEKELN